MSGFFMFFFLETREKTNKGRLVFDARPAGMHAVLEKLGDLTTTLPLSPHTVISLSAVQAACIIRGRGKKRKCITQSLSDCIPCSEA